MAILISHSRALIVKKGAIIVMEGQKLARSIYKLLKNTVIGGVATTKFKLDNTLL